MNRLMKGTEVMTRKIRVCNVERIDFEERRGSAEYSKVLSD